MKFVVVVVVLQWCFHMESDEYWGPQVLTGSLCREGVILYSCPRGGVGCKKQVVSP